MNQWMRSGQTAQRVVLNVPATAYMGYLESHSIMQSPVVLSLDKVQELADAAVDMLLVPKCFPQNRQVLYHLKV